MKLSVEHLIIVLYLTIVRRHRASGHPAVNELRRHHRLRPSNVLLSEQELPVQVGDVYRVHVDDVNHAEAHERQVLEQLAAESPGADDEHAQSVSEELDDLGGGSELGMRQRAGPGQEPLQVGPVAGRPRASSAVTLHLHCYIDD